VHSEPKIAGAGTAVATSLGARELATEVVAFGDARVLDVALSFVAPVLDGRRAIGDSDDSCMTLSCIDALGTFFTDDSRAALHGALEHRDLRIRRDAAKALGRVPTKAPIAWLKRLENDPERQVRDAAARAIEQLMKL
jgi:HEAT repeat protein